MVGNQRWEIALCDGSGKGTRVASPPSKMRRFFPFDFAQGQNDKQMQMQQQKQIPFRADKQKDKGKDEMLG
jgi:hypothetical protein